MSKILLLEDNLDDARIIEMELEGHEVRSIDDLNLAFGLLELEEYQPDIILLDPSVVPKNQLVRAIKELGQYGSVTVLSGQPEDSSVAKEVRDTGIDFYNKGKLLTEPELLLSLFNRQDDKETTRSVSQLESQVALLISNDAGFRLDIRGINEKMQELEVDTALNRNDLDDGKNAITETKLAIAATNTRVDNNHSALSKRIGELEEAIKNAKYAFWGSVITSILGAIATVSVTLITVYGKPTEKPVAMPSTANSK